MTLTILNTARVYRTARAAQRDRGNAPALTAGTYPVQEQRGHLARLPAGWINTKGHT
ncbi:MULTISPECIES: hypothetical protein [unclassified Microbacterium]|uniref:hypothetical protein n=1 Tax=unclassified Microbacterium TaxID=2609290 RepID=UPI003018C074